MRNMKRSWNSSRWLHLQNNGVVRLFDNIHVAKDNTASTNIDDLPSTKAGRYRTVEGEFIAFG